MANIGDLLRADQWNGVGAILASGNEPVGQYPGAKFRVVLGIGVSVPVNLVRMGKDHYVKGAYRFYQKNRVKIEFVQDGEPSLFAGGWLHHD